MACIDCCWQWMFSSALFPLLQVLVIAKILAISANSLILGKVGLAVRALHHILAFAGRLFVSCLRAPYKAANDPCQCDYSYN